MTYDRQDIMFWLSVAGIFVISFSPTVAGMLWRAAFSVWLVWLGIIDFETYSTFASDFHW